MLSPFAERPHESYEPVCTEGMTAFERKQCVGEVCQCVNPAGEAVQQSLTFNEALDCRAGKHFKN